MENIKEIQLSNEEMEKVYEAKRNGSYMSTDFIADLYKYRYKLKIAPSDIAKQVGKSKRAIQFHLKNFGWEYDIFEAQKMSAKKKDYNVINKKAIKTLTERNYTSQVEKDIRKLLSVNIETEIEAEIIVGMSTRSIIPGSEIDIPIVIINNGEIFKYAIEINGDYWHKNRQCQDAIKLAKAESAGYKTFTIWQHKLKKDQDKCGSIEKQVHDIVNQICKDIKKTKAV